MIAMPDFLRKLIESEAYTNRQDPDHQITNEKAEYYMRMFYPGDMEHDATGKFVAPEFDMTLAQFDEAQRQIESDFEEAKGEAESEILEEYGEYFENLGISFDIDLCVQPGELIPVKVLYDDNTISIQNLETYDLDIPDFEKVNKIWIWHSDSDDGTCDECESMDDQTFFDEDEVPECPVHPNCRCWVEEVDIDEDGNVISRTRVAGDPAVAATESLPPLTEEKLKTDAELNAENSLISEQNTENANRTESGKNTNENNTQNNQGTMSNNGINYLKDKENVVKDADRHVVYNDANGRPVPEGQPLPPGATIGYGHLVKPGEDFSAGLTEAQAIELLRHDIQIAERAVRETITVPVAPHQFDALAILAFNIGAGGFKGSTIAKYITNPDYRSAAYPTPESAWKAWNITQGRVSNGLINRRNEEWNLYQTGNYGS